MERCNQTAFRGSPLYHAAIASLQRAQLARVKWQPGYRTRKRWTGVQKILHIASQTLWNLANSCKIWKYFRELSQHLTLLTCRLTV
uniref:Alternative protein OSBPL6 n=1 Tax=Homo sapiens TaxID=9606 RepID=L8ECL3_HUMAN|nr:alternative protein OSBPL6 [Homo sapiens]